MFTLYSIFEVVSGVAISLGVGASTFAIVFYFMSIRHPELREIGRPYQKVVYIVLRVAMMLILLTEIAKVTLYVTSGTPLAQIFAVDILMFVWTLVGVLFVNAILMTLHIMPMRVGPALQATSWYTLGVVTALPIVTYSYIPLLLLYGASIVSATIIIEMIVQRLQLPLKESK